MNLRLPSAALLAILFALLFIVPPAVAAPDVNLAIYKGATGDTNTEYFWYRNSTDVNVAWSVTGATSCTASASPALSGWSGAKAASALQKQKITVPAQPSSEYIQLPRMNTQVSTGKVYTLTLSCTGAGTTVSKSVKAVVRGDATTLTIYQVRGLSGTDMNLYAPAPERSTAIDDAYPPSTISGAFWNDPVTINNLSNANPAQRTLPIYGQIPVGFTTAPNFAIDIGWGHPAGWVMPSQVAWCYYEIDQNGCSVKLSDFVPLLKSAYGNTYLPQKTMESFSVVPNQPYWAPINGQHWGVNAKLYFRYGQAQPKMAVSGVDKNMVPLAGMSAKLNSDAFVNGNPVLYTLPFGNTTHTVTPGMIDGKSAADYATCNYFTGDAECTPTAFATLPASGTITTNTPYDYETKVLFRYYTNGVCAASVNSCSGGTFSDVNDTVAAYMWSCNGSNGGSNASCAVAKPAPNKPTILGPATGYYDTNYVYTITGSSSVGNRVRYAYNWNFSQDRQAYLPASCSASEEAAGICYTINGKYYFDNAHNSQQFIQSWGPTYVFPGSSRFISALAEDENGLSSGWALFMTTMLGAPSFSFTAADKSGTAGVAIPYTGDSSAFIGANGNADMVYSGLSSPINATYSFTSNAANCSMQYSTHAWAVPANGAHAENNGITCAGAGTSTLLVTLMDGSGVVISDVATITISPPVGYTCTLTSGQLCQVGASCSSGFSAGSGTCAPGSVCCLPTPSGSGEVTLLVIDGTANESGDIATLRATRTISTPSLLNVNYLISGNAGNGVDYSLLQAQIQIPANLLSADIVITPINDTDVESDENVTLTLAAGTGYTIGSASSATATIIDNDSLGSSCGNGVVEGLEQCEQTSQCTTVGNVCSFCDCLQTTDRGNVVAIEIISDAQEYPIPGTINLKVRLTRKSTFIGESTFTVSESKIGLAGEKQVGAGSVDFVSQEANTAIIDLAVPTNGHEAGIYTYTARITNGPLTETYKTDNIDSVSVTLQKSSAAAPEIPVLFVGIIAVFALAIIRISAKAAK